MGTKIALLICLGSTWFMAGLIWFVQVVHYPLFNRVGAPAFPRYHSEHTRRTTWVVLLPMVLELGSAAFLAYRPPIGSGRILAGSGLAAALVAWGSTFWVQVPLHERLASGFEPEVIGSLVRTNLVRAFAWTLHAAIVLAMVGGALR